MDDLAGKLEGPLLIGIFINAVLLGVMTTQVYLYFTTFKDDRIGMKVFVIFLFLCDIVNTLCDFIGLYETLIQHFGDADYLTRISWLIDTGEYRSFITINGNNRYFLSTVLFLENIPFDEAKNSVHLDSHSRRCRWSFRPHNLCEDFRGPSVHLIDQIQSKSILAPLYTFNSGMHLLFSFVLCKLYSNSLMSTVNSRGVWMRSFRDDMPTYVEPINFLRTTVSSTERGSSFGGAFPSPIKVPPPSCHSTSPRTEVHVGFHLHPPNKPAGLMANFAENFEGPLLVGTFLNAALLGVMITQVYLYFTSFRKDKIWMKIFVSFLFVCDVINSTLNLAGVYMTLVRHFGDYTYLTRISWLFDSGEIQILSQSRTLVVNRTPSTDPAMTGIIVTSCQLFFAWRIYQLRRNMLPALLVAIFATVGGDSRQAQAQRPGFRDHRLTVLKTPVIIWLSSDVIADILITISLISYLHKAGFNSRTDSLIDRIIRTTIQTGTMTALVAILDLLLYTLKPNSGLHLFANFVICKLYSNSLMSTLNSRGIWMKSFRDDSTIYVDRRESWLHSRSSPSYTSPGSQRNSSMTFPSPLKTPPQQFESASTSRPRTEIYVNVESIEERDHHLP
ncbi:hypothetical protein CVT26_009010 [Gymnopilus dilepis]|uniref:DUF6534 domain-containing protein n=1 Tax=Gymnopilus dilepis TaxID=231916 RepID=A0A409YR78_9AGAR|nr:hypothetical protein CVT26_009010 [Gymnopilus dilepis]